MSLTSWENCQKAGAHGGGGGGPILAMKVEEYRSTLEQMDQHVGVGYLREVMKQGSEVRGRVCVCVCVCVHGVGRYCDDPHWVMMCT